jgi:hypothetical protein
MAAQRGPPEVFLEDRHVATTRRDIAGLDQHYELIADLGQDARRPPEAGLTH